MKIEILLRFSYIRECIYLIICILTYYYSAFNTITHLNHLIMLLMENEHFFKKLAGNKFNDAELRELFNSMVRKKVVNNHHILLREGEIPRFMWFIDEGFAMAYILRDGKKIPYLFWNKLELIIASSSFFKQIPSASYIETLEKSNLSYIHFDDFNVLMNSYTEIMKSFQEKIEDLNARLEYRVFELIYGTVESRYKNMNINFPAIVIKVPVELIASYLGVSRKTLNRVRTKTLR